MSKRLLVFVLALVALMSGCGQDNGASSDSAQYDNGLSLMGLVDKHTLQYIRTDTTISFSPTYTISVSVTPVTIKLARSADQWIIKEGDTPRVNLRVTNESVLQNGYWQRFGAADSLFYIPVPPSVMMRSLWPGRSWEGFTPRLATGQAEVTLPFYYTNFGFSFTRKFIDIQPVVVPAGSFSTHHFTTELFANPYDSLPAARIEEYFAANVGLVQLNFSGGPLIRTLSLVNHF